MNANFTVTVKGDKGIIGHCIENPTQEIFIKYNGVIFVEECAGEDYMRGEATIGLNIVNFWVEKSRVNLLVSVNLLLI